MAQPRVTSSEASLRNRLADALDARTYAAVINTAAYTAVDKAESDIAEAWPARSRGAASRATAETNVNSVP